MSEKQGEECFVKNDEPRELEHYITIPITEYKAMRLDAERYRWLREADAPQMEAMTRHYGDELDEVVDAAIISTGESR